MPDTIRTLSELNSIFADNTTANISPQDLRDLVQSTLVHAVIGTVDNATVDAYTATPQNKKRFTTELHARHITTDLVNAKMTVPAALTTAKYDIGYDVNVTGQSNDGDFTFAVFKNGSTKINATERTISVSGTNQYQVYLRIPGITLAGNDTVELGIKADGNKNLLITNGSLSLQRVGIE